jgi:hypothetical protein
MSGGELSPQATMVARAQMERTDTAGPKQRGEEDMLMVAPSSLVKFLTTSGVTNDSVPVSTRRLKVQAL